MVRGEPLSVSAQRGTGWSRAAPSVLHACEVWVASGSDAGAVSPWKKAALRAGTHKLGHSCMHSNIWDFFTPTGHLICSLQWNTGSHGGRCGRVRLMPLHQPVLPVSAGVCGTGVASSPGTVGALSQAAWWPGTSFPSGSHQDWAWGCVLRSSDVSARRWNCARELTDGWRRRNTVTGVGGLCNPSHCPHIWSVFKPHTVKPELCKCPYLLIKGIGNTVALHSYKLHYWTYRRLIKPVN